MDSIAVAWWKRPNVGITIDYGQRAAAAEIQSSAQICKELGIQHEVVTVDCGSLGSGDMSQLAPDDAAPTSEWWPYRNQLLVTLASMRAISMGVQILLIGTVRSDGENHKDGTDEFVRLMHELVSYQEGNITVAAPAIQETTAQLILNLKVPPELLAWAHSCHKANIACGNCRGCNKYLATYAELGSVYSSF